MTIQADPDDLDKHSHAFDGHVDSLTGVHDSLYDLLAGDVGLRGSDATSNAYRENYLYRLQLLADSIKGAREGVSGISQGMRKMASDYRATDDASLQGVNGLVAPSFLPKTPPGTAPQESEYRTTQDGSDPLFQPKYVGEVQNPSDAGTALLQPVNHLDISDAAEPGTAALQPLNHLDFPDAAEPGTALGPRLYDKTVAESSRFEPVTAASPRLYEQGEVADAGIEAGAFEGVSEGDASDQSFAPKAQLQGVTPGVPREGVMAEAPREVMGVAPRQGVMAEAPRQVMGETQHQGVMAEAPRQVLMGEAPKQGVRIEAGTLEGAAGIDESTPQMASDYRGIDAAAPKSMLGAVASTAPDSGS